MLLFEKTEQNWKNLIQTQGLKSFVSKKNIGLINKRELEGKPSWYKDVTSE